MVHVLNNWGLLNNVGSVTWYAVIFAGRGGIVKHPISAVSYSIIGAKL